MVMMVGVGIDMLVIGNDWEDVGIDWDQPKASLCLIE